MEVGNPTKPAAASSGGAFSLQDGELPEWFLFELLPRLPIADVFRFNCISKQCASVISDPSFRRTYFSRLPSPPQEIFVFFPTRGRRGEQVNQGGGTVLKYPERHLFTLPTPPPSEVENSSLTRKSKESSSGLRFPPIVEAWEGGPSFYTVADDKGFLLVGWVDTVLPGLRQDRCKGEFFICSAITHQWFSLPSSPPKPFVIETVGFVTQVDESGRFLTSYRVVIIDFTVENIAGTFVPDYVDLQVFSSETRSWEPVRLDIGRPFMLYRFQRPVFMNTTVYWTDPMSGILAYDPYESYRVIEPPSYGYTNGLSGDYSSCGAYQGRLKYFEKLKSLRNGDWKVCKIWELQEDGKWCLQHTISIKEDAVLASPAIDDFNLHTATFLSFDQLDPDIVYLNMHKNIGVASFNVPTKRMELIDPKSFMKGNFGTINNYRWFLLKIPTWPILIPPYLMSKELMGDDHRVHP